MNKVKDWVIKDTDGNYKHVDADVIITDSENKIFNFYLNGELVGKFPIAHVMHVTIMPENKIGGQS